jgi:hypothetical protein
MVSNFLRTLASLAKILFSFQVTTKMEAFSFHKMLVAATTTTTTTEVLAKTTGTLVGKTSKGKSESQKCLPP